jgi:hypothetical protein
MIIHFKDKKKKKKKKKLNAHVISLVMDEVIKTANTMIILVVDIIHQHCCNAWF